MISIDGLAEAITENLKEYSEDVAKGVNKSAKTAIKTAVKVVKSGSPKDSGEYASGWASKVMHESDDDIRAAAYNKKKPSLTHVLEKGHAKVNGGRVEGIPHIQPAEEAAVKEFEEGVKEAIRGV